jgi:phage repressor protein C with HTH and peptisase S24 domain
MNLSLRIKAARKHAGLTQRVLAGLAGVEQPLISQLENGATLKSAHLAKIAQACGVDPLWLAEGIGTMLKTDQSPTIYNLAGSDVSSLPLPVDAGRVPVIGKAMLGMDGFFEALDYPAGGGDGHLNVSSKDPHAYALRVVGNSMTPRIKNNEFVLVEPNHPYVNGDDVLVRTADGRAMIKEFVYLRDGQYRFDSYGNGFEPVYLAESEVALIHFVGGIFKSYRFTPE